MAHLEERREEAERLRAVVGPGPHRDTTMGTGELRGGRHLDEVARRLCNSL
jgi:hypothetical protein